MDVKSIDLLATSDGIDLYNKLGFKEIDYTPMKLEFS